MRLVVIVLNYSGKGIQNGVQDNNNNEKTQLHSLVWGLLTLPRKSIDKRGALQSVKSFVAGGGRFTVFRGEVAMADTNTHNK